MYIFIYKYIKLHDFYNVFERNEQLACKLSEVMLSTFLELSTLPFFFFNVGFYFN